MIKAYLELEAEHGQAVLVLEGLSDLLVVDVPVDHVQLHGVLVAVYRVLGPPAPLSRHSRNLAPVEVHLDKLVVHVERTPAQQRRGVVGHRVQFELLAW